MALWLHHHRHNHESKSLIWEPHNYMETTEKNSRIRTNQPTSCHEIKYSIKCLIPLITFNQTLPTFSVSQFIFTDQVAHTYYPVYITCTKMSKKINKLGELNQTTQSNTTNHHRTSLSDCRICKAERMNPPQ